MYLLALRPDLSLRWVAPLRGHLNDGCGVLTPYGDGPRDCRPGSARGVDPATNLPPAGWAPDFGSSSPTALPDGGVLYAAFTGYNGQRGHLMKFDRRGRFVADYDFGWDYTPAVYVHDRTYSVIVKDNHYQSAGPFVLTRLDADLNVEWQHANTSTQTCRREPDGRITCVDTGEHPNGFEWCINAPAVDRNGTVYALNGDGYMYGHRPPRAPTRAGLPDPDHRRRLHAPVHRQPGAHLRAEQRRAVRAGSLIHPTDTAIHASARSTAPRHPSIQPARLTATVTRGG